MVEYAALPIPSLSTYRKRYVWNTMLSIARRSVRFVIERSVSIGILEVVDCDGSITTYGNQPLEGEIAKLVVLDEAFWVRVYSSWDIGFSEAYMNGDITSPDFKSVLKLAGLNKRRVDSSRPLLGQVKRIFRVMSHRFMSHGFEQSIRNVAGYDAANELYKAFLSEEMQYSCPIWTEEEGGLNGDLAGRIVEGELERAQARKIKYVLAKARLRPGHRLLEIGSGWGELAITAARMGCEVDSLTLSVEQKILAEQRVRMAGVEKQVRIHLLDYRKMPASFHKAFDACVALEMIEAVGLRFIPTFIKKIDWALKDDKAAIVLSATAYPDSHFSTLQGNNFIRKYHWPHTMPPSATWLASKFHNVLGNRIALDCLEDFSQHYCRCLREWGKRLDKNWTPELVEILQQRYPSFRQPHVIEAYKRRWHYMFLYMEVAYSTDLLKLNYWTFVRPGYPAVALP